MRVLIVEDNAKLAGVLLEQLRKSGIASDHVTTVAGAEKAIAALAYAAIVLDLGLPDGDGLDLVDRLRLAGAALPIIITSARHGLDDRLKGLRAGADDYLSKPFSIHELIARLQAIVRRPHALPSETLRAGNVTLDPGSRQINVGQHHYVGRLRESLVLEILMRHQGGVVRRDFLLDHLYGDEPEIGERTVDVHVHRLRRQLADLGATVAIHTIRGVGLMLAVQSADPGGEPMPCSTEKPDVERDAT